MIESERERLALLAELRAEVRRCTPSKPTPVWREHETQRRLREFLERLR